MVKKYKPTSPGRRDGSVIEYKKKLTSTSSEPRKQLTKGKRSTGGRNSDGRITTHYRGGGNKRTYRLIDFKYNKIGVPATVETIEYDPNRSGFIALVCYADGDRRYILAPQKLKAGDTIIAAEDAKIKAGNRLPLHAVPVGTFVYNVEINPGAGARLARSAGNYAEVVAQDKTRGAAKNAVDHPHGGGEGKSPRGHRRQRTKQGRPTGKGQKTRSPKKYSNKLIVLRRKLGKVMGNQRQSLPRK